MASPERRGGPFPTSDTGRAPRDRTHVPPFRHAAGGNPSKPGSVAALASNRAAAALLARLLVVLVALRVCEDSGPLDLALEPTEGAVQRLVLANSNLGQPAHLQDNQPCDAAIIHDRQASRQDDRDMERRRRDVEGTTSPRNTPLRGVEGRSRNLAIPRLPADGPAVYCVDAPAGTRFTVTDRTTRFSLRSPAPLTAKSHPHVFEKSASEIRKV